MRQTGSTVMRVWQWLRAPRRSTQAGFSLTETTIMLAAMTVLTATAAPSIMDYVAQARGIKAHGDIQVLTGATARLIFDVSRIRSGEQGDTPDLLVGPGDAVELGRPDGGAWTPEVDGNKVQLLEGHLVTNEAGYTRKEMVGFSKGWSGPYVDSVPVDPWGHRYGVNIGVMDQGLPVVVLSAGPNGKVETPFRLNIYKAGGDDILGLMGSGR